MRHDRSAAVAIRRPSANRTGMQIHITPRHIRLTASIHRAAASQVSLVEDLGVEILGAHVVLMHDDVAKPEDRYTAKVHLAIRGPDLHAEASDDDLYVAMERAVDKICRQLRKRKTSGKDRLRIRAQKATEAEKRAEDGVSAAKRSRGKR